MHTMFSKIDSAKIFCDETHLFLDIHCRRSDGVGCLRQLHHVLADSQKVICLIDPFPSLLYRIGKD